MAPCGWRDREMKKKSERAHVREREKGEEREREKVIGGEEVRVEKRRTGIWYRRHCFRSPPFSLPLFSAFAPAKIPST